MVKIGKKLKKRAKELGLSDAEVARRAGIEIRTYGFYATDERQPPYDKLVKICKVLKITPDDLLGF